MEQISFILEMLHHIKHHHRVEFRVPFTIHHVFAKDLDPRKLTNSISSNGDEVLVDIDCDQPTRMCSNQSRVGSLPAANLQDVVPQVLSETFERPPIQPVGS